MAAHDVLPGFWLQRKRTVECDHSDHVAGETDFSSLFGNQPIWFGGDDIYCLTTWKESRFARTHNLVVSGACYIPTSGRLREEADLSFDLQRPQIPIQRPGLWSSKNSAPSTKIRSLALYRSHCWSHGTILPGDSRKRDWFCCQSHDTILPGDSRKRDWSIRCRDWSFQLTRLIQLVSEADPADFRDYPLETIFVMGDERSRVEVMTVVMIGDEYYALQFFMPFSYSFWSSLLLLLSVVKERMIS